MAGRIVHVVTDPSFMSFVADVFEEVAPGRNTFVSVDLPAAEMRITAGVDLREVSSAPEGLEELADLVGGAAILIAHGMRAKIARTFASAVGPRVRVWSGWGGDYYGTTFSPNHRLLGPMTRQANRPDDFFDHWLNRIVFGLQSYLPLRAAARAAGVFSAPVPDDLHVFRRRFPSFRGRYGQLNYVSVEDSIATGEHAALGPNILVGNAAAAVNNHIDVFAGLARLDLANRKVVVPLSYGDRRYAERVEVAGREMLGAAFAPIREFLPLDEYNSLVGGCGTVVVAARRQVAMGNVLRALWQGSHVVLDPASPSYTHLRREGVAVTTLAGLLDDGVPEGRLTQEQLEANRRYLARFWSRQVVVANVRSLVSMAED